MKDISLYIGGRKVDLEENSLILFNYAVSEATNPTIVKNSYSQQVKVKGTNNNNRLFGEIFRLDRKTIFTGKQTGANFDPMRKTPFEIYDASSSCLESGYVKLNTVVRNGADIEYHITLYGGLGAFLYGLSYKENGSKKTLLDMVYPDAWGTTTDFKTYELADRRNGNNNHVFDAWQVAMGDKPVGAVPADIWDIINFAPAYNGFPKDFDADRAIHKYNQFQNSVYAINEGAGDDLVTWNSRIDAQGYVLTQFTHKHTEWELRDLRWYLQRPVISFKKIIGAICLPENNGGYRVELDESFFSDANDNYNKLWMTLSLIATEDRESNQWLRNILAATNSPAEYLLSYIKMFGLMMMCDTKRKVVYIMRRDTWYNQDDKVYDLSHRVNRQSSIEIQPQVVDCRRLQFGGEVEGEFAEAYKEDYGFPYGIQRVDTSYEFNDSTKELTESIVFKPASEVLERSRMFMYLKYPGLMLYTFPLPAFEVVETELWATEEKSKKFQLSASVNEEKSPPYYPLEPNNNYVDLFAKVQLHSQDNTPIDGQNVLLYYAGKTEVSTVSYYLSQDIVAQGKLNGEKPCWNLSPDDSIVVNALPRYARVKEQSLDWGVPLALGHNRGENIQNSLYNGYWKGYITDLYDANAKVLRCKTNLRGLPVGMELFRKFYWYENSLWVLNKVSNYSLTTHDDAECEFIRVNQKRSYTNSQNQW
jgi:hypothetical protein